MPQAHYLFGWLCSPLSIADTELEIQPVRDYEARIRVVQGAASYGNGWFYPPIERSPTDRVDLPSARFELPATHVLETAHRGFDTEFGDFVVLVLGFLLGLRLMSQGAGHLLATPWRPGTLVDFTPFDRDLLPCLRTAIAFWDKAAPEDRKLLFAAAHWYLVAQ